MRIGYITHRKGIISRLGNSYLDSLCVRKHATHGHHFHEKNLPPLHKEISCFVVILMFQNV